MHASTQVPRPRSTSKQLHVKKTDIRKTGHNFEMWFVLSDAGKNQCHFVVTRFEVPRYPHDDELISCCTQVNSALEILSILNDHRNSCFNCEVVHSEALHPFWNWIWNFRFLLGTNSSMFSKIGLCWLKGTGQSLFWSWTLSRGKVQVQLLPQFHRMAQAVNTLHLAPCSVQATQKICEPKLSFGESVPAGTGVPAKHKRREVKCSLGAIRQTQRHGKWFQIRVSGHFRFNIPHWPLSFGFSGKTDNGANSLQCQSKPWWVHDQFQVKFELTKHPYLLVWGVWSFHDTEDDLKPRQHFQA